MIVLSLEESHVEIAHREVFAVFDRGACHAVLDSALVGRPLEQVVDSVLAPALDQVAIAYGSRSKQLAFALRVSSDRLRRASGAPLSYLAAA